jgi:hypothetical protein
MRRCNQPLAALTALALATAAQLAQAAPPPLATPGAAPDEASAQALYEQGRIKYDLGEFAAAARLFEESYRLSEQPLLLYNLGQAHRQKGDCARALHAYRSFVRRVGEIDAATAADLGGEAALAREHMAKLSSSCSTAEPSPQPIPAPAAGGAAATAGGPAAAPAPKVDGTAAAPAIATAPVYASLAGKLAIGASVIAVGSLVAATGYGISARRQGEEASAAKSYDPQADVRGERAQRLHWGFLGLGAAATALAGYWFWQALPPPGAAERATPTVGPLVVSQGGGAVLGWTY